MSIERERLQHIGRREEKRLAASRLKLSITGIRDSIREHLDPFADDIRDLPTDLVAEQAFELADKMIQYKALMAEIAAIDKAMGTPHA